MIKRHFDLIIQVDNNISVTVWTDMRKKEIEEIEGITEAFYCNSGYYFVSVDRRYDINEIVQHFIKLSKANSYQIIDWDERPYKGIDA